MHIGFYNPYFDTLGGGERYVLSLASHLSSNHKVEVFWNDPDILRKATKRFDLDLSRISVTKNFFATDILPLKLFKSYHFDLIFFFTDGSIPLTMARNNILMYEIPFQHMKISFWKMLQFSKIVSISKFTSNNLPRELSKRSSVIYPPVDVDKFNVGIKENLILSVGRFGSHPSKKHLVLIQAFAELSKKIQNYRLILAGGLHRDDLHYFHELQKSSKGMKVELLTNISFDELRLLYTKSKFYWHAAGYGETNPEHMEHFGITPVEAMASGSVPLVFNGGGLPEIIQNGISGVLWQTIPELVKKTSDIIANPVILNVLRVGAMKRSRDFHPDKFYIAFENLLLSLDKK